MDRDHVSLNRKVLAEKKTNLQLIQTKLTCQFQQISKTFSWSTTCIIN
jgi:hypothetical protein